MKNFKLILLIFVIAAFNSCETSDDVTPENTDNNNNITINECGGLKPTSGKYNENDNLATLVQSEYGSGYTVADWNDVKAISNINSWISCMGLVNDQSFNILRNGEQIYSGTRQYFMRYCSDGNPGSNFLIHDQIGSYIFLGSWTGTRNVLAKVASTSNDCSNLKATEGKYNENNNLVTSVQSEYGSGYSVADWNDVKAISNISSWISCMGLVNDQSFNLLRNGNQVYSGDRQYFMRYCSDGDPGSNFLIHDQIGSYIFLGSWTGSRNVLAIKK